jgi:phytanoyl-CoA hydroxylase
MGVLTEGQRSAYATDGFIKIEQFAPRSVCDAMLESVVAIAETKAADGWDAGAGLLLPEANLRGNDGKPADLVSKIFKLHREPVFCEFALDTKVTDVVAELIGTDDLDCFLSQFIFKNPGAWGQPWHQDSFYFPFDPHGPVVGIWLAVTEATLENGCLHVLPGSNAEPIHEHIPDRRPNANLGYVEIVDHDMRAATPVLMQPGDLLVFDSHLMHRSTDNESEALRAAMVYHYARAGTTDYSDNLVNDWMPARRADQSVFA